MRGENIPSELAAGWEEGEAGRWISSPRRVQHAVNEAVRKTTSSAWSGRGGRGRSSAPVPGNTVLADAVGRALPSTPDFSKLLLQLMTCV